MPRARSLKKGIDRREDGNEKESAGRFRCQDELSVLSYKSKAAKELWA
jgi:hypothetical protein